MEYVYISFISAFIILVGVYQFYLRRKAVIHNQINKHALKPIGEIKDGEIARINAKVVHAGRTLIAPLSKRKCVLYKVRVKDSSGPDGFPRSNIDITEEKVADVVVFDGSHYAVIDTKLLAAYTLEDKDEYTGFLSGNSDELIAFLEKRGEPTQDYLGRSLPLSAHEAVIEEGETLNIAGKCSWRKSSDFKFKLPTEKVLFVQALNEHGIYLTDDPYV